MRSKRNNSVSIIFAQFMDYLPLSPFIHVIFSFLHLSRYRLLNVKVSTIVQIGVKHHHAEIMRISRYIDSKEMLVEKDH